MNSVVLMGRLTRDPDVRYANTANGQMAVARYSIAVDRRGQNAGTDFISCVAFGRTAEFAEKYFHKGTKILIEGRIQTGSYKNRDGQTVYTTDVVVSSHEFCEKREDQSGSPQNGYQQNYQGNYQQAPPQPQVPAGTDFMAIPDNVDDDGLPFN